MSGKFLAAWSVGADGDVRERTLDLQDDHIEAGEIATHAWMVAT
jgi:hypothetical protein